MNEHDWNEILDNAEDTVLRKAKKELGEEAEKSHTIIDWLETQQVAIKNEHGDRAQFKNNLLQFISAQS